MPLRMDRWQRGRTRAGRAFEPYRDRRSREQRAADLVIRRWFGCILVMLAVTALNFLPFSWAASCQKGLTYLFRPGAAAGTKWAAWADLGGPERGLIQAVWQRFRGLPDAAWLYPCTGQIISGYAWRHHPLTGQVEMHYGIDIAGEIGNDIRAAAEGTVIALKESEQLGLCLLISHVGEVTTCYGHLQEATVSIGDWVEKGQVIGKMGAAEAAEVAHLHFEVQRDGEPIDPLTVLPR